MAGVRVRVLPDLCCGNQRCVEIAADVYEIKDGFNALVENPGWVDIPDHLATSAVRGAKSCPERAILVERDEPNPA